MDSVRETFELSYLPLIKKQQQPVAKLRTLTILTWKRMAYFQNFFLAEPPLGDIKRILIARSKEVPGSTWGMLLFLSPAHTPCGHCDLFGGLCQCYRWNDHKALLGLLIFILFLILKGNKIFSKFSILPFSLGKVEREKGGSGRMDRTRCSWLWTFPVCFLSILSLRAI